MDTDTPPFQVFAKALWHTTLAVAACWTLYEYILNAPTITPILTYSGTVLVLAALTIVWVWGQVSFIPWRYPGQSSPSRIHRLGPQYLAYALGVLVFLWLPRFLSHPRTSKEPAYEQYVPETITVDTSAWSVPEDLMAFLRDSVPTPTPVDSFLSCTVLRWRQGVADGVLLFTDTALNSDGNGSLVWRQLGLGDRRPYLLRPPFPVSEARYERVFQAYESALILSNRIGSGNFADIHVLMWVGGHYVDLADAVPQGMPDAEFSFADLDDDGRMELIVAPLEDAYFPTQLFSLDADGTGYEEVPLSDPRYSYPQGATPPWAFHPADPGTQSQESESLPPSCEEVWPNQRMDAVGARPPVGAGLARTDGGR